MVSCLSICHIFMEEHLQMSEIISNEILEEMARYYRERANENVTVRQTATSLLYGCGTRE